VATDRLIASIAEDQHGNITRKQLLAAGLRGGAIDSRLASGRLHVVHRGVYALLPAKALPPLAPQMAAVLACGDGAILSHESAAAVWGLRPALGADAEIDVTVVGRNCGPKPGIRVHRLKVLEPIDSRRFQNIPITAPARTLLDIAGSLAFTDLERAVDEAIARELVSPSTVRAVLERYPRRSGSPELAELVSGPRRTALTRSDTEKRFKALIRKGGVPPPEFNVSFGRYTLDCLWRRERLVVELDGYQFHSTRSAFERDHERDLVLKGRDFEVLRFTWKQVRYKPELVLARLVRTLALREPRADRV
jgi:very-short-patch-repair endonuclease